MGDTSIPPILDVASCSLQRADLQISQERWMTSVAASLRRDNDAGPAPGFPSTFLFESRERTSVPALLVFPPYSIYIRLVRSIRVVDALSIKHDTTIGTVRALHRR